MEEGRGGVAVMGLRCGDWRGYICRHTFFSSSSFLCLFLSFLFIFGFIFPGGEFFVWGGGGLVICVTAL